MRSFVISGPAGRLSRQLTRSDGARERRAPDPVEEAFFRALWYDRVHTK